MFKNEIKVGAVIGYINIFVQIVVTLIYVPITIKLIGQSEYGLYSLVVSFMSYFSVLDMGFGNAMIRFVSRSKARADSEQENAINGLFLFLYSIIGIIAVILGLIVILNVKNIFSVGLTINEINKARVLMIISITSLAVSFPLSVFDSYIMACEKFVVIKFLNLLKNILTPVTIIIFLYFGYDSIAMVLITGIYKVSMHLLNMFFCIKKLNMKIKFNRKNINKTLLKEIVFYSFFIFLNILIDNLYNNTDKVILGSLCGTLAVSVYAVATTITSMNVNFSTSISGLFLPRVTKLIETKDYQKKLSDLFIKISRIQLYIMTLILSGFIIFGKHFLTLWVGKDYLDAYYIILLLIGPSIIPLTQNIGISILQALNKHGFRSIIYFIIAILNIILSIPLAKLYGGIGAAIGTALATFVGQIVTMNIYYWKKINIDIPKYWFRFIGFVVPIIIVSVIIERLIIDIHFGWLGLFGGAFVFLIIYSIYSCVSMNKYEKESILFVKDKLLKRGNL